MYRCRKMNHKQNNLDDYLDNLFSGTSKPNQPKLKKQKRTNFFNQRPKLKKNRSQSSTISVEYQSIETYQEYIKSPSWQDRHKYWLRRTGHRCQLFPWVKVGWVDGKYYPYAIHHLHMNAYKRRRKEVWNRDVIVVSKFAHNRIFHWLLSAGKTRVGDGRKTNHNPKSKYQKAFPNIFQRLANWYCRLTGIILFVVSRFK